MKPDAKVRQILAFAIRQDRGRGTLHHEFTKGWLLGYGHAKDMSSQTWRTLRRILLIEERTYPEDGQ